MGAEPCEHPPGVQSGLTFRPKELERGGAQNVKSKEEKV